MLHVCRMKIILADCLIISVFTLKMHKNDLEKNCSHSQLMSLSSRGSLTQAETWAKAPTGVLWGLFFYRVRKLGSFKVLLVFFSTFPFCGEYFWPCGNSLEYHFKQPGISGGFNWRRPVNQSSVGAELG